MEIEEAQNKIREFDKARGWENDWNIKDLALNMTEEVGELWNLIKWINDEKQKRIVDENREEVSDFVGDALFLILKIANQTRIDAGKALEETLKDFEKRAPSDEIKKVGHMNKFAGGVDKKE